MKKVFTLVALAGMFTFVACGPSQAEKDAAEKAKNDSVAAVQAQQAAEEAQKQQMLADSTAKFDADAKAKMVADSTAAYETEHAKKGKKK